MFLKPEVSFLVYNSLHHFWLKLASFRNLVTKNVNSSLDYRMALCGIIRIMKGQKQLTECCVVTYTKVWEWKWSE